MLKRFQGLDERDFPHLRQQGESAESFLRRAADRGIAPVQTLDVQAALREHFADLDARARSSSGTWPLGMSTPPLRPSPQVQALWDKAEAHVQDFVGMTIAEASEHARRLGLPLRVLAHRPLRRADLSLHRVNAVHDDAGVIIRTWRG